MPDKTHREVKSPAVSARYLADYMPASERAKRSIIAGCKYQAIAPLVQHEDARSVVARHLWSGVPDDLWLRSEAERVRRKLSDSDFEAKVIEVNADYITRFADVLRYLSLPKCDVDKPGKAAPLILSGVKVNPQIAFRTRRLTKTNEVRIGAGSLRYLKGKPVTQDTAEWQASFLHGYLVRSTPDPSLAPEAKLCVIIDAFAGACIVAPTNSVSRFNNMEAACATIAERWPNIEPPKDAIL